VPKVADRPEAGGSEWPPKAVVALCREGATSAGHAPLEDSSKESASWHRYPDSAMIGAAIA
jgi:hypothetical protein